MIVRGGGGGGGVGGWELSKRAECPGSSVFENDLSHCQAHIWADNQNNGRY